MTGLAGIRIDIALGRIVVKIRAIWCCANMGLNVGAIFSYVAAYTHIPSIGIADTQEKH